MAGRNKKRKGRLLLIGGSEDPDPNEIKILPHLVKTAGGRRARIVVCSAPTSEPEMSARHYRSTFLKLGAAEVFEAPVRERAEADEDAYLEAVMRASAIFFTGGDQLRLTSLVAGTHFSELVRDRLFEEGMVVAGTSAGAAAVGSSMIVSGQGEGTVRRADITMAPGLGYWRDTVIDTHFNQRGRVHRLMAIFAQNPQVLGVGLDENTAIDLTPGAGFSVVGEGAVMVFDGRVSHSNAADAGADEILAITDATVHVLPEGYGFNLKTMRPVLPGQKELPEEVALHR